MNENMEVELILKGNKQHDSIDTKLQENEIIYDNYNSNNNDNTSNISTISNAPGIN